MKNLLLISYANSAVCVLIFLLFSQSSNATAITSVNYDTLLIGAKIVGPVGPDVEVSLINLNGDSVGDLSSSVSCPDGFTACEPPLNASGTIYTYTHTVIPGVDNPNDAPFPNPGTVLPFDDVSQFSLGFAATGFNGVAGYSFTDAANANVEFSIELLPSGEISWVTNNMDWDTGETITFFWQTTQAPSGPGGTFNISNSNGSASGAGPIPTAIQVKEPATLSVVLLGLLVALRRVKKTQWKPPH